MPSRPPKPSPARTMLAPATLSEYQGVRSLHLGTPWIQGSMRMAKPLSIELEYVQRMLASLLWLPTEQLGQGVAVQLGLGAGALTRFTHRVLKMPTRVVELNPQVILACRACFCLGDDDGLLQVFADDAARWVCAPAHAGMAQLLHVDLYDHEAAAPVLDDEAFYAACHALLAPGGVMAVNLFGRDASFERSAQRIAAAFGADQVWSLRPTREGNTVVVAGRGVQVPGREVLQARAEHIEAQFGRHGLPAGKWLRMVHPYTPSRPLS